MTRTWLIPIAIIIGASINGLDVSTVIFATVVYAVLTARNALHMWTRLKTLSDPIQIGRLTPTERTHMRELPRILRETFGGTSDFFTRRAVQLAASLMVILALLVYGEDAHKFLFSGAIIAIGLALGDWALRGRSYLLGRSDASEVSWSFLTIYHPEANLILKRIMVLTAVAAIVVTSIGIRLLYVMT